MPAFFQAGGVLISSKISGTIRQRGCYTGTLRQKKRFMKPLFVHVLFWGIMIFSISSCIGPRPYARNEGRFRIVCQGPPVGSDFLYTERGDVLINGEKCKFRDPPLPGRKRNKNKKPDLKKLLSKTRNQDLKRQHRIDL